MRMPDDLKHPSGGEQVDELAHGVLKLAHEAIERFPEMKRRHMFMAGGAAVSSAVIVAAGVAILHRIRAGAQPEQAVQEVTEEEIEGLRLVEREHYRPEGYVAPDHGNQHDPVEIDPLIAADDVDADDDSQATKPDARASGQ